MALPVANRTRISTRMPVVAPDIPSGSPVWHVMISMAVILADNMALAPVIATDVAVAAGDSAKMVVQIREPPVRRVARTAT